LYIYVKASLEIMGGGALPLGREWGLNILLILIIQEEIKRKKNRRN